MKVVVGELMMTKFVKVGEDDQLWQVMIEIAEDRETMLACVVDETNKLKGIITPKRFLRAIQISEFKTTRDPTLEWGEVLSSLTSNCARDMMGPPISVQPDQPVQNAINIMLDTGLYELPVVDKSGKMIGEINFFHIIIDWAECLRAEENSPVD